MSDPVPPPAEPRRTQTMQSDRVRLKFTDIVAAAEQGTDTIITWYNRPIAVVICYQDYIALRDVLQGHRSGTEVTQ